MESVLAIGDARNDFDMIQKAGWGCAPANAAEEIRAIARFVSPKTNEEDAVANILEHVVFD
jgi:hydroxymethylpyrimidine pyrophosphatase-like HAD family hydrolase